MDLNERMATVEVEIRHLTDKVDSVEKRLGSVDDRVAELEKVAWRIAGGLSVVILVAQIIGPYLAGKLGL